MHRRQLELLLTTCYCRDTGGKRTRRAQRTSFNTLDNWGHKTPTQSKKRKDKTEEVKGSWPETYTIHSVTYIYVFSNFFMDRVACIASSKSDNDLLF